jgi:hypothetical protein
MSRLPLNIDQSAVPIGYREFRGHYTELAMGHVGAGAGDGIDLDSI